MADAENDGCVAWIDFVGIGRMRGSRDTERGREQKKRGNV
jgi:hypothetical protein